MSPERRSYQIFTEVGVQYCISRGMGGPADPLVGMWRYDRWMEGWMGLVETFLYTFCKTFSASLSVLP